MGGGGGGVGDCMHGRIGKRELTLTNPNGCKPFCGAMR